MKKFMRGVGLIAVLWGTACAGLFGPEVTPTTIPFPTTNPTATLVPTATAVPPTNQSTPAGKPTKTGQISPERSTAVAQTPLATATAAPQDWALFTNGNTVRDLVRWEGALYAATGGGVVQWNLATGEGLKYTTAAGLPSNEITSITACGLPEPRIVAGTAAGLAILDPATGQWAQWNTSNSGMANDNVLTVTCLNLQEPPVLAIGYSSGGLDLYNGAEDEWIYFGRADGLASDNVRNVAMMYDKTGAVSGLAVSSGFNLSIITNDTVEIYDEANGLADDTILDLASTAEGDLWLATLDGLIWGDGTGLWQFFDQDQTNIPLGVIQSIAPTADGHLWLVTSLGRICLFSRPDGRCIITYEDQPRQLERAAVVLVDAQGTLFVGDGEGGGIGILAADGWQILKLADQLANNGITGLAEDTTGQLWVATENGLLRPTPAETTAANWTHFTSQNSGLLSNILTTITADPRQGLWLGSYGGLGYFDGNSTWLEWGEDEGMLDDVVRDIALTADGRVWVATDNGLSVWDGTQFTNFTAEEGLTEPRVATLLAVGNELWLGTDGDGLWHMDSANQLRQVALAGERVTALATDNPTGEMLWVGSGRFLYQFQPASATLTPVPAVESYYIADILPLPTGEVWVGTTADYAYYFDGQTWAARSQNMPAPQILQIFMDSTGSLWFAGNSYTSGGGGLGRYTP